MQRIFTSHVPHFELKYGVVLNYALHWVGKNFEGLLDGLPLFTLFALLASFCRAEPLVVLLELLFLSDALNMTHGHDLLQV